MDEKQFKDAVQQEMGVEYRQQYHFDDKVKAGESRKFVLVFDKFTIPDKKIFKVEIYEKDGGRHINFRMKNDLIIGAKAI